MPELQQLRADHATAVLRFETDNRAYFAASIADRGDAFFDHFADQHADRLAEQETAEGAYYVLVEDDGSVVGRVNLIFTDDGCATLGYRVAQNATGRGVATTAVRELCDLAAARHGMRRIVANTSLHNVASQKVLARAGFTPVGPADPADVGGKPGLRYERSLRPD